MVKQFKCKGIVATSAEPRYSIPGSKLQEGFSGYWRRLRNWEAHSSNPDTRQILFVVKLLFVCRSKRAKQNYTKDRPVANLIKPE